MNEMSNKIALRNVQPVIGCYNVYSEFAKQTDGRGAEVATRSDSKCRSSTNSTEHRNAVADFDEPMHLNAAYNQKIYEVIEGKVSY